MKAENLVLKLQSLPLSVQKEVMNYLDFLLNKYSAEKTSKKKKSAKLKFDWEGGIAHLKKNYTSVELQHKANVIERR